MTGAASTLSELVAPLSEAQLLSLMSERKPTLLRGLNKSNYRTMLGWDGLRRMLERGEHPPVANHEVRLSKESVLLPPDQWSDKGRIDIAKVEDYLARGFSLVVTHVEQHIPPLAQLCEDIKSRLHEASYVGVIVTEGAPEGAFKTHYDPEDLILFQIEGTKRWHIFDSAIPNAIKGMRGQKKPKTPPIFDEVLEPGDVLVLPAGTWHHCECGPERSIHVGLFFVPPTSYHAMCGLNDKLLSDATFRLPLTRVQSEEDLAALEADVKERMIAEIRSMKLDEFREKWARRN